MNPYESIILKATAAALALSGVACASAPEQQERQMASAETSIELAQQNGAQEFGPAALERAQMQLKQAETAAIEKDYDLALRLAERAELDAQLALAQTNHEKAARALQELQESIDALRSEIARNRQS